MLTFSNVVNDGASRTADGIFAGLRYIQFSRSKHPTLWSNAQVCSFLLPVFLKSESRTSSGQLTASVPTPRLTHSVMMVSVRIW